MSRILLAMMLAGCALVGTGCTSMVVTNQKAHSMYADAEKTTSDYAAKAQDTPGSSENSHVSYLPYVATSSVAHEEAYPSLFLMPAEIHLRGSDQTVRGLMASLSRLTKYTVTAAGELTRQTGANGAGSQAATVAAFAFQGNTKTLLDHVAGMLDATWEYDDHSKTIRFFRTDTRVFHIATLPGMSSISSTAGGGGSGGNTQGGGSGQSLRVNSSESKVQWESSFDLWETFEANIKPMLSNVGTLALSEPTASITVHDRWDRLEQVEQYVKRINRSLTTQVKVNLAVYRVVNDHSDSRGMNWNVLYNAFAQRASTFGVEIATPFEAIDDVASLILESPPLNSNGNPSPYQGSQFILNSLSSLGKTSIVTQNTVMTVNNVPAPFRAFTTHSYLAKTGVIPLGDVDGSGLGGAGVTLEPGTVETGFDLSVLPSVQPDGNRILMQLKLSLSTLDSLESISSGGQLIQIPTVSGREAMPRVWMQSGQSLVLATFAQDRSTRDTSSPLSTDAWAFAGNRAVGTSHQALVLVITPVATSHRTAL